MRSRWYWFGIVLIIAGAVGFILTAASQAYTGHFWLRLTQMLNPAALGEYAVKRAVVDALSWEKWYFASLLAVAVGVTILHREHIARRQP